MLSATTAASS